MSHLFYLQQRAQIEYDLQNGDPILLEIHWDTIEHCPVLVDGGHIISMNHSKELTLREILSLHHIYVGKMDGMIFGEPFYGSLLDCTIEHLPLCQLTIHAPFVFARDYVYRRESESEIEEILEEIEVSRTCVE